MRALSGVRLVLHLLLLIGLRKGGPVDTVLHGVISRPQIFEVPVVLTRRDVFEPSMLEVG